MIIFHTILRNNDQTAHGSLSCFLRTLCVDLCYRLIHVVHVEGWTALIRIWPLAFPLERRCYLT